MASGLEEENHATVESAVKALKLGAYDYIKKPFKRDSIP